MAVPQEYREIMLQPGEFYFGEASTRIRTLLGSCVAITAWHPTLHVGGMCHYLLATREGHAEHELDGRYGDEALQLFLREMTARGTHPKDYQIKLFGGGDMFPSLEKKKHAMEIGARNITLARTALESLGATVMAQDVGDIGHRSIIFDVWSGDVWVKHQRTAGVAEPDRRETVSSKKPIQVLVVDDSATVRQVLAGLLSKEPDIQVMAVASNPIVALEHMKKQWPDVITLDIEMPRMDGISFLKHVMATRPTPVVICSSLTEQGAAITIQALAAGALSIITKPKVGLREFLEESSIQLVDAVKAAAQSNMQSVALNTSRTGPPVQKFTADVILAAPTQIMASTTARIVAIGTSTGGTQALESVLTALSRRAPGIVIVQHMPETFTAAFAERLNSLCQIDVREAKTGDRVVQGQALVAPGGRHLLLKRDGTQYCVEVVDGPLVNRHRPSVDVLFRSVAKCAGGNALGIIMTGMGDDGAAGLLEMRKAGAKTIGQNESTCVVYGMPKEAMKRGATEREVPLSAIAPEILAFR